MYKTCKKCNETKEITDFHKNHKAKDKAHTYCKACNKIVARISTVLNKDSINEKRRIKRSTDSVHRKNISIQKKKSYWNKRESNFIINAKRTAKLRNLEFSITVEDITIPEKCPVLNVLLDRDRYSPSLDRIDNTKGYIKGNIWVISRAANRIKNDATLEELFSFCENLPKLIKNMI